MQIRISAARPAVSAVGSAATISPAQRLIPSRKVIAQGIDLGITLFRYSDIYAGIGGSETFSAVSRRPPQDKSFWRPNIPTYETRRAPSRAASRRYIMSSVEARLNFVDDLYIDLYAHHSHHD